MGSVNIRQKEASFESNNQANRRDCFDFRSFRCQCRGGRLLRGDRGRKRARHKTNRSEKLRQRPREKSRPNEINKRHLVQYKGKNASSLSYLLARLERLRRARGPFLDARNGAEGAPDRMGAPLALDVRAAHRECCCYGAAPGPSPGGTFQRRSGVRNRLLR